MQYNFKFFSYSICLNLILQLIFTSIFSNQLNLILFVLYVFLLIGTEIMKIHVYYEIMDAIVLFFSIIESVCIFLCFFYIMNTNETTVYTSESRILKDACNVLRMNTIEDFIVRGNDICSFDKLSRLDLKHTYEIAQDPSQKLLFGEITNEIYDNTFLRIVTCNQAGVLCYPLFIIQNGKKYILPWDIIQSIQVMDSAHIYAVIENSIQTNNKITDVYDIRYAINTTSFIQFQSHFNSALFSDMTQHTWTENIAISFLVVVPAATSSSSKVSISLRKYSAAVSGVCMQLSKYTNAFEMIKSIITIQNNDFIFNVFLCSGGGDSFFCLQNYTAYILYYISNIILSTWVLTSIDIVFNVKKKRNVFNIFSLTVIVMTVNPVGMFNLVQMHLRRDKYAFTKIILFIEILYICILSWVCLGVDFRNQQHDILKTHTILVPCTFFSGIYYYLSIVLNYVLTLYSIIVHVIYIFT